MILAEHFQEHREKKIENSLSKQEKFQNSVGEDN